MIIYNINSGSSISIQYLEEKEPNTFAIEVLNFIKSDNVGIHQKQNYSEEDLDSNIYLEYVHKIDNLDSTLRYVCWVNFLREKVCLFMYDIHTMVTNISTTKDIALYITISFYSNKISYICKQDVKYSRTRLPLLCGSSYEYKTTRFTIAS